MKVSTLYALLFSREMFFFNILSIIKFIHVLKQCFSLYENEFLQLMSAGASLEKYGEKALVFIKWSSCKHCFKIDWTLVASLYEYFINTISWKNYCRKTMKCSTYRKDFPPLYLCNFMTLWTRVRGQKNAIFFSKTLWRSILCIDPKTSSNMQKEPKSFSVHPTTCFLCPEAIEHSKSF